MSLQEVVERENQMLRKCSVHYIFPRSDCPECVRLNNVSKAPPESPDAVDLEAPLQEQIEGECRRRQWPFVRTRMNKPTTFTFPGTPDFVIAASNGRTIWLEAKSRTGKQTPEQIGFQMMLNKCGHIYHLVRSAEEVLRIFDQP